MENAYAHALHCVSFGLGAPRRQHRQAKVPAAPTVRAAPMTATTSTSGLVPLLGASVVESVVARLTVLPAVAMTLLLAMT